MSGKYALIIGNTEYTDPGLSQLTAPGKDSEDLARVLKDQGVCAFDDVKVLLNEPEPVVREAVDEFFDQKKPDDLLVLYFSGHGVRDELGALYLAVKNTNRFRLRSTALKSDFIREVMDQSRSKRQVLILDCCNSGAFAQGTKAATGVSIGTATAFEAGYGRMILTASDSTQFAWEGDQVIGETDKSLFTHFLVEGLQGEADLDCDGHITVDELYDYAYEKVKLATPKQTPSKFSSKQQGEIVLRQITRIEDIKPVSLSEQLLGEIENPYPEVRLRAVEQLTKLLNGKNLGLARSAREALERIEKEDDSYRVRQAASQALASIRQAEQLALQKAEEERLAAVKVESERKAREEAERLSAEQRAEEERRAREEAERLAVLKAEEERLVREKIGSEEKIDHADVVKESQAIGVSENPIQKLIYKTRNSKPSKWDLLYWTLSLGCLIAFLARLWFNGTYLGGPETYRLPLSYFLGSGLEKFNFAAAHSYLPGGGFLFLMLYFVGGLIQAWVISKYYKVLVWIWLIIILLIPFGLGRSFIVAPNYEFWGSYILWVLLPAWVLVVPVIMLIRKGKSQVVST